MAAFRRLLALLALLVAAAMPAAALAECGGSVNCIAVGGSPGEADTNHHGGGSGTFIMSFGTVPVGTTSPSQTAYVAAVTGPPGTMADLGVITIQGADAPHFLITGGTCSDANGPVHGGPQCTITIAFNPLSGGPKSAQVIVPLDPPICAGCITHREFTVAGTGAEPPPEITSALAVAGAVGAPFNYQITATNNPTSFGATNLPPGLALAGGGRIQGTPTTAGTYNATIRATNSGGTATETLVITIQTGTPPPSVTPIAVMAAFGAPTEIDLAQGISGNFTSVAIAAPPSNGTATLAGTVATYTPAAGFSGTDSFTYTATGPGGTSAPATVTLTVGAQPPTAGPASMTVQANTPATLDLAPYIGGAGVTRVSVVTQPDRGRVTASGTEVTYTPNPDVFGADAFTYIAIGSTGSSAPATVTVTIQGRPDPARNRGVTGVIEAQSGAAQRFSDAQIGNVQRRMEALHRGAPGKAGGGFTLAPMLASLAATGAMDVSGGRQLREGTNLWAGGTARFGEREADGTLAGFDFTTSGLTVGLDRRIAPGLVVGAALGAARDRSRVEEGTESRARGVSGALYASWQSGNAYVDALLGGGRLDFESSRFIGATGATAEADRDGSQVFGSLAAGYEHRRNGVLLSPYARVDFSRDRLEAMTESGAAEYDLAYSGQSATWLRGAVGVRAEGTVETRFGWTTPRVRAEYRRQFKGERTTSLLYADLADGTVYSYRSEPADRNSLALGIGTDLVFRGGLTVGIDYEYQRASGLESDQALRILVSQQLSGTGALRWLEGLWLEPAPTLDLQVEAGITYDDNVTRALAEGDRRGDRAFGVTVRKSWAFPLGNNARAIVAPMLGGEKFQFHNGLSHADAGVRGELQYRPSAAFGAPTFTLFADARTEQYESRLRDGERYSVGGSVRAPLTDRVGIAGSLFHNRREAASHVFDGRESGARVSLDWQAGRHLAVYASADYRRGDLVTSANPVGPLAPAKHDAPGAHQAIDDVFRNPDLTTARFEGRSWIGTLGFNYALGPRDAIDFSWRRVRSRPDDAADVVIGFYVPEPPVRYTVDQFFLLYLMSF